MTDYISRQAALKLIEEDIPITVNPVEVVANILAELEEIPAADVRKNVKAKKVIGGGEHDGATCWLECSSCHGSVDIEDAYCKHCGAVLEYEK